MILIFGPTGSGKSMQGQFLAARNNWRWLSAGQLLRDEKDPVLLEQMRKGELVDFERSNQVVQNALKKTGDIDSLVLDGYPRVVEQAKFLIDSQPEHGRSIKVAIVLDVDREVVFERLGLRGRADDNKEAIEKRLDQYDQDMPQVFEYLKENKVPVFHVDGNDTVGRVHDRIMQVLNDRHLI